MERKLSLKQYLYIGSMLFGLFFGAGNLIFPVNMGQLAGSNVFLANLGFLVTGIGLPFLGVIAIGVSQSEGVLDLASKIGKKYAFVFTFLIYMVIGPFFALPRLATTSFEIGVAPFVSSDQRGITLTIFSIVFFVLTWFFSRKPTRILDYVGKFLNPIFLLLLGILLVFGFSHPLGSVDTALIQPAYQTTAFFKGFTEGYNTLDALASLAFGIIIVTTIRSMGIKNPNQIARDTIKSGAISIVLMGLIYTSLAYLGAMSLGKFAISENGGVALAQIANYYLGTAGSILLALIVISACLKTSIGLVTAFSETFVELFPRRSYQFFIVIASALPCLFANIGLTKIIEISLPVLMFIYPLAMTLILLSIISPLFKHKKIVYQTTTAFTVIAAIFDALAASPAGISGLPLVETLLTFAGKYLPFFTIGMGWILPALVGFLLGLIYSRVIQKQ
ncbi:branched-chain amino acid transport system II carrier protein [Enterococcus dongliensis]|uniref:Branched-chain amino acid transport system carrier protein n=1 Tax=Enterococcus dongliensis TaxID=2559925 RepID=A0AAP5NK93_9ENTE|nr:branched-chain amino acid transport system II carrier protein [Enterococcus dongliensis]MDT2595530.1 branched-chain amino acid transport system II carrier protein [Enterococcus dongliensis]MDT2603254.1 branched-chain amino acid transport system II carrier protein [Enterococcus dongliensis]MDT2633617.1 branched-chain amino acid transport system II carrier protein [Enterococcus dongliensis]MDT2636009.1 branched-chain amino acid transport system II carrier protein [Enterococcus dongliensis]MDT